MRNLHQATIVFLFLKDLKTKKKKKTQKRKMSKGNDLFG